MINGAQYSQASTLCAQMHVRISDGVTGELRISNHSQSFAGLYLCEANNAVGAERCRIVLKAHKRKELKQNVSIHVTSHDESREDLDFSVLPL